MVNAVFVAPFFLKTTVRFVAAAAGLPGVRLSLISQDPAAMLPEGVRDSLAAHRRIADGLDAGQILRACADIARETGRPQRVIGTLEQLQVPLAQVRAELGLPGLGLEAALNFRDKARMKTVLRAAGVPCARHALVQDLEQALTFARSSAYPLIAKPPDGAGATNTFRVETEEALRQAFRLAPPRPGRPTMLEEFVVGEEHSFDTVSIDGRHVWHSVTRYYPGPLEVLENPWIQWCVLLPREVDAPEFDPIRDAGCRALDALGMGTGLSHMEWFRREDGSVAISEVGARPPGAQFTTLISYAHDLDMYRAWCELMLRDTFDPPERRYAAGIAFLRGQGRGTVRGVRGLDRAQRELGHLVVETKLPSPGQTPASGYEGEGYVVLRHPSTDVVRDGLARLVRTIRVELG